MQRTYYTAEIAKQKYPDAKTVFIGPCIAKRKEAQYTENVDYILTFEELGSIFGGLGIDVKTATPYMLDKEAYLESHGYGQTGGVSKAVNAYLKDQNKTISPLLISNLNKKNIALLRAYAKTGKCPNPFIEVMACEGGCVTGPSSHIVKEIAQKNYNKELAKMAEQRKTEE